jgi:hypothetical protein
VPVHVTPARRAVAPLAAAEQFNNSLNDLVGLH